MEKELYKRYLNGPDRKPWRVRLGISTRDSMVQELFTRLHTPEKVVVSYKGDSPYSVEYFMQEVHEHKFVCECGAIHV